MQHLVEHQDWELLLLPLHTGVLASDAQWFVWWHNHWLLARHYDLEDTIVKNYSTRNLHCMHSKVEIICLSISGRVLCWQLTHRLFTHTTTWFSGSDGISCVSKPVAWTRQGHSLWGILLKLLILKYLKLRVLW